MAPSDRHTCDHPTLIDRHLARAVDRLARQGDAAARLPAGSPGKAVADTLLATLRQSFALMASHRATILRELADDRL